MSSRQNLESDTRMMMKKLIVPTLLAGVFSLANAQEEAPARSIMFQDQNREGDLGHLTTIPDSQRQDRGNRCIELLRKVEELKGKPQRRSAAMARYRAECELP